MGAGGGGSSALSSSGILQSDALTSKDNSGCCLQQGEERQLLTSKPPVLKKGNQEIRALKEVLGIVAGCILSWAVQNASGMCNSHLVSSRALGTCATDQKNPPSSAWLAIHTKGTGQHLFSNQQFKKDPSVKCAGCRIQMLSPQTNVESPNLGK